MKSEPEFDLIGFLKEVDRRGIRCLLIGRWAVAQHGAPVVTADYDFWIDPDQRSQLFELLEEVFDAELPEGERLKRPLVTAWVGPDKIDCFSARKVINDEGQQLTFDQVYARSVEKRDPQVDLVFRVPSIEDLIALKKFAQKDPVKHARNLEDIRYLVTLKKEEKMGGTETE